MKIRGFGGSTLAIVVVVAFFSSFMTPYPASATVHSFVEDLTSWQYRYASATTADWDTTAGTIWLHGFGISNVNSYNTSGSAYHVTMAGDVAYVSDHTGGFTSIDVTDPYGPDPLDTYSTPDAAFGSAVAGDLAFVACWSAGLVILDVSDPDYILHKSTCDTPGYARAVAVGGDYAYVADMGSGLQIIDISNPSAPVIVGNYSDTGDAYDLEIAGNFAYVADNAGGLVVIDISDPVSPSLHGEYHLASARGIDLAGNIAYVANYFGGLFVIDVSDPSSPSLMDEYDTPGNCYNVHVAGDYAYIADGSSGGIRVMDVSDPYAVSILYVTYTSTGPLDVRRQGEYLYIADAGGGLAIKRVVSAMPSFEVGSAWSTSFLMDAKVYGNYVYSPAGISGLRVIDVSDPFAPVEAGYYTGADIYDIAVCGDTAFAAAYNHGIEVLDVSDPAAPAYVNMLNVMDYAYAIDVSGNIACVAGSDGMYGLAVVDVSNPAVPVVLDRVMTFVNAFEDVSIEGNIAWVCAGGFGFMGYDMSDPSNVTEIARYNPTEYVYSAEIAGNYAYLSCGLDGIQVLSIAYPPTPSLVGSVTDYSCRDIAVYGDQLFSAAYDDGIIIYDLSDPESPDFRTRLVPETGTPYGIAVDGDFAYVAGYQYGLRVMRVYDWYYEGLENRAGSFDYPSSGLEIKKVRLTTSQSGLIDWEYSLDSGASWFPATENDGNWADAGSAGSTLRWKAEFRLDATTPDESPECSSVRFEWLHEPAVIDSVIDVPADQGGYVRVHFSRSSLDFDDEAFTPVTAYDVYRRVDDPLLALRVVENASVKEIVPEASSLSSGSNQLPGVITFGEREFIVAAGATQVPGFPPGVWENVASVHALQTDQYLALVPTEADSAATIPYEAFVITTHTTSPATWFVSPPDSGYSTDDIAPAAPAGLELAYNTGSGNTLSWDESPDEDLQYYRIYRGTDPDFAPEPGSLVAQTASTGWNDPEHDGCDLFYKVTAVDCAGNESEAAVPATVTGDENPGLPLAVTLRQNVPNPFNPSTTIRFELPQQARVRLAVYNVKGEAVRTLVDDNMPAGVSEVVWNGERDDGHKVVSGIYFYRLSAEGVTLIRKMVLLR